mmetsp:Transcript_3636/g.7540  ORF Transcript_3636/g.7540 Transcript_3636/m.7540 type:complete len:222 (-) Transcript_3636:11-676(-)
MPVFNGATGRNGCCGGCSMPVLGGASGLDPVSKPVFGMPMFWFALIQSCTADFARSRTPGSAAEMMTAFPPPGAATVSMLICAPVSVASFLMVAPAGPMSLPTSAPGQMTLLSTQLPGAPASGTTPGIGPRGLMVSNALPGAGTMVLLGGAPAAAAPGAPCPCMLPKSLIMSPKSLSICAFFSACAFQSTLSRLFASAAFLQSDATWPLSPQMVHTTLAIL